MADDTEYSGEKCVKCNEVGEDRRTLWMACFYAMNELDVPFEQTQIKGTRHEFKGNRSLCSEEDRSRGYPNIQVPEFAEEPVGEERRHQFFTLRVCKRCRSDWMRAVELWFHTPTVTPKSCGTGIFVRENGVAKEITLDEWEQRRKQARTKRTKRTGA